MASHSADRRTFLSEMAGIAGALTAASVAGCLGDDEDVDDEPEPIVDEAESLKGDTDPESWADVDEIRFDAYVGGWVGVEPAHVDRVENPTLVLFEGRSYEIVWENRDNVKHNLAIYDAGEELVDEYATDVVADVGATATLEFTATPEMTTYICEHQPGIQRGDIEIVDDEGAPIGGA